MILSTSYFPNIQHLTLLAQGAKVEVCENYQKQSLRNRCEVLSDKGLQLLTVPVLHNSGQKIATRDVQIDNSMPWARNHLRALRSYYAAAPFFDHFFPHVEALLTQPHTSLVELNTATAELLGRLLKMPLTVSFTDHCEPFTENDPRVELSRKRPQRPTYAQEPYYQVFSEILPFHENLSALDLLFCEGAGGGDQVVRPYPQTS